MNGQNNNRSGQEKALDRLVSEVDQELPGTFVRPSDGCIHAYLSGDASEAQQELMWAALDTSPAFRREILEMAEEMEVFTSPDAVERASQLKFNEVPARILRMFETPAWLKVTRILVPVAAAIILVPIVLNFMNRGDETIPPPVDAVANLELFTERVDPALLVSMRPRGVKDTSSSKIYSAPDSAALGEFRFLLEYEDGEFKFLPEVPQPVQDANARLVQLKIQDDTGKIIKEFTAVIPVSDSVSAPVEAWILNLPTKSLYKVAMTKDTVVVKANQQEVTKGCVTFTYGGDNWFKSTFGFIYNFEEAK